MPISNLNSVTLTYHNIQARRIELNRRRIYAKSQMIFGGRIIPESRDVNPVRCAAGWPHSPSIDIGPHLPQQMRSFARGA